MVRWMLTALWLVGSAAAGPAQAAEPHSTANGARRAAIPAAVTSGQHFSFFVDPDEFVSTKEFALFYNRVPDSTLGPDSTRRLFHLVYQRSGGPQALETVFGHAWSTDLSNWLVDTLAFTVDGSPWDAGHVW